MFLGIHSGSDLALPLANLQNLKLPGSCQKCAMQGPEQDHLLVPLLVLLAQQRQHIATQTPNSDQLKLLLELFDQCSETLSQVSNSPTTPPPFGHHLSWCSVKDTGGHKYPSFKPLAGFSNLAWDGSCNAPSKGQHEHLAGCLLIQLLWDEHGHCATFSQMAIT